MKICWSNKWFNELNVAEVYSILQLRAQVFIVEQDCPYLDIDGVDQRSMHVYAYDAESENKLVAYARMYSKKSNVNAVHFGRFCVSKDY